VNARVLWMSGRGTVTLPFRTRERYHLEEGDLLAFIDLDGVMLLAPLAGVVGRSASEIESQANGAGVTVEELSEGVRQERSDGQSI
jgi:bifunctional DNA-binding transcriptional regulator/antitoxin component of YhaV-PrlF toxin-antitoxin module